MKGKGKKGRDSSDDECPLQFPDFEPLDVIRFCPRFNQIVARGEEEEGIGLEDLDDLQTELEAMLVDVRKRSFALQSEIEALTNWQESQIKPKKGGSSSSSPSKHAAADHTTPGKRKQSGRVRDEVAAVTTAEERPSKRSRVPDSGHKDSSSSSSASSSPSGAASPPSSRSSTTPPPLPSSSKSQTSHAAKDSKVKSKSKNLTSKAQQQYDDPYQQKNDLPDRFWTFTEPFTAPVRPEHCKLLEDMIRGYEDESMAEFYKVPNRGKHYSTKWATAAAPATEGPDAGGQAAAATTGAATTAKTGSAKDRKKGGTAGAKGGKRSRESGAGAGSKSDEKGSYGILTQRLIQSLLEDSSSAAPDSPALSDGGGGGSGAEEKTGISGNMWKQVSTGNTAQIEKRIRKELQDHGLIELDEPESGSASASAAAGGGSADEDEILRELTKCQSELRMVASTNASQLKSLLALVRTDLQRQELEARLAVVDEEVIEGYKRLMSAKSKKRTISKKEKDACLKSLKDREELVQQLDALQLHHLPAQPL